MKSAAGVIFALLLIVLFNAYEREGMDGVRKWFGAKFLNRNYLPPADAPSRPSSFAHGVRKRQLLHLGGW